MGDLSYFFLESVGFYCFIFDYVCFSFGVCVSLLFVEVVGCL